MQTGLVQTATEDKLILSGYFVNSTNKDFAVLHIHGFEGNFYENNFIQHQSKQFEKNNIAFLTANTRGCEKIKEFRTVGGEFVTVGARFETLEESPQDIDTWVKFLLDEGFKNIVLQGHSLGTYKIVRYLFEGKFKEKVSKLVLISPFDKLALVKSYIKTPLEQLLTKAEEEVKNGNGRNLVSKDFDEIEFSYSTFLSWYKLDDLGKMFNFRDKTYNFPTLSKIQIPTLMVVGSKDEYFHISNPSHPEEAVEVFKKYIKNCETQLIDGAKHDYIGYESNLSEIIEGFVNK